MLFASVQVAAMLTPLAPLQAAEPEAQPQSAAADDFVYTAAAFERAAPVFAQDWTAAPLSVAPPVLAPFEADDAWMGTGVVLPDDPSAAGSAFAAYDWFL